MWSPPGFAEPTLIRKYGLMMSDLQGLITKYLSNLSTHYHTSLATLVSVPQLHLIKGSVSRLFSLLS